MDRKAGCGSALGERRGQEVLPDGRNENLRLGDYVLVNRGANVGHHAVIEDLATIGPGAVLAGAVRVCRGAVIGAGAVVLPQLQIGRNAFVGAGAVVTRSVPTNTTVVGNPARVIRTAGGIPVREAAS